MLSSLLPRPWPTLPQCCDALMQENEMPNDIYTVELSFPDSRLEPSEISSRLRLQPSNSLCEEQIKSLKRVRHPYWRYNGEGEPGYQSDWEDLEHGLAFLLEILNSRKSEIIAISREIDGLWWCGYFQSSLGGGPELSAKLLTELGGYGTPLFIDNYDI